MFCIPNSDDLKHWALRECHDNSLQIPFGIAKTMDRLNITFCWPGIARTAQAYVRACEACQANKPSNHQKGGLLQPLPIPQRPWESVYGFYSQLTKIIAVSLEALRSKIT